VVVVVTVLSVVVMAHRVVQVGALAHGRLLPAQVAVVALTTVLSVILAGMVDYMARAAVAVGVLTVSPVTVQTAFLPFDLFNKEYYNGTH
jgi:hypothetical protein